MSPQLVIPLVLIGLVEAALLLQRLKYKRDIAKIRWFNSQLEILRALSFLYTSRHQTIKEVINDLAASFFLQNRFDSFVLITLPLGREEIFRVSDNKYSYIAQDKVNTVSYDRTTGHIQKQDIDESTQDLTVGVSLRSEHSGSKTSLDRTSSVIRKPSTLQSGFYRDKPVQLNKTLTPLEEYIIKYIEGYQRELETANNTVIIDFKKMIGQSLTLNTKEQQWKFSVVMPLVYFNEKLGFLFFFSKNNIVPSKYDTDFVTITGNILSLILKRFRFDKLLSYQEQLKASEAEW